MNAYFTPVKWLNPIYVGHTKNELDVMLSAPLYFDIDMQDLTPSTFSEAKRHTIRLIEFLEKENGRCPDLVVFSGRQGFHVYFWEWDMQEIQRLSPIKRLVEFRKRRTAILKTLKRKKIVVDERITADPFRILRIPNTLHGKTGLIAKPVLEIEKFNPEKEATAFDLTIYAEVFELEWDIYE
jgi:DNA primase small subunit